LISSKTKESIKVDKEPCLVVLSQLELDTPGTQRSLRTLLEGLEQMKPDIIILIGDFISEKNAEKQTYD